MGMAPTFVTRYISDSDCAISPSGRRGRAFKHGTSFYNKVVLIFLDNKMESLLIKGALQSYIQFLK
jgi:hypothetical protein